MSSRGEGHPPAQVNPCIRVCHVGPGGACAPHVLVARGQSWGQVGSVLLWGALLTPGTGAEPRKPMLNPESIVTLGCLAQKPRLSQQSSCPC